jgi:hypothetical protein
MMKKISLKTLGLMAALLVSTQGCNLTPGVPVPPPARENFVINESQEDCRGVMVVEVVADPFTFEAGDLVLVTNTVTRTGILAPAENDGSVRVEVPAADGEDISIRRRTTDGEESLPIVCNIPSPWDRVCQEPVP